MEGRARDDDDFPGRRGDRERSLVSESGEHGSEPQRDDRDSWIWTWRRDVEARDGHLSMRKEELLGKQGCGEGEQLKESRVRRRILEKRSSRVSLGERVKNGDIDQTVSTPR